MAAPPYRFPSNPVNQEKLIERILIARPNASIDEVRRLAPTLADTPDHVLEDYIAGLKRRLTAKTQLRK